MDKVVLNHNHPKYLQKYAFAGENKFNGAYYYSKEICKYFVPKIKTDRSWITINVKGMGMNHSIVFIHNNLHPENYNHLMRYGDMILVCGIEETMPKVKHLGTPITLPLSVDVPYVEQFKTEKSEEVAFVGRPAKSLGYNFPPNTKFLMNMPREELLREAAKFENVYAVGRAAIECKILGCNILPYDKRFPDPSRWEILDSREAAKNLQKKIDKIDKRQ